MNNSILVCTCECGNEFQVSEYEIGIITPCSECGCALHVCNENTVSRLVDPASISQSNELTPIESSRGIIPTDCCERCAKPFRGDWDQHQTDKGTYCNICARQAYGEAQIVTRKTEEQRQVDHVDETANEEYDVEIDKGYKWWFDPESKEFKMSLYALAVFVMLAGIYFTLFSAPDPIPDDTRINMQTLDSSENKPESIPTYVSLMVYIVAAIMAFLRIFLFLFVMMKANNKLPHDDLPRDIIAIGIAATVFMCFSSIGTIIPALYLMIAIFSIIGVYYYLCEWNNLTFMQFIFGGAVVGFIVHLLIRVIKIMIIGAIYHIFV